MRISDCSSYVCSADLGACTVLLDGESVKSCTLLAVQADGESITTIEGLADGEKLHPVQAAFREHHGLQCGFCTPGMVMAAVSLLAEQPDPTEHDVREGLEGNLCRCTGYRSEEHTSELQSLMRISYAVFCLKQKITKTETKTAYYT